MLCLQNVYVNYYCEISKYGNTEKTLSSKLNPCEIHIILNFKSIVTYYKYLLTILSFV